MVGIVGSKRTRVRCEICGACHGSYPDAGELRQLCNVSISDFFKDFAAAERE
jgi:Zn-finger nucleic acid-binding protein